MSGRRTAPPYLARRRLPAASCQLPLLVIKGWKRPGLNRPPGQGALDVGQPLPEGLRAVRKAGVMAKLSPAARQAGDGRCNIWPMRRAAKPGPFVRAIRRAAKLHECTDTDAITKCHTPHPAFGER